MSIAEPKSENTDQPRRAPAGLKGLVVAETNVGSVRGQEGFFHYRQYDATELARTRSLEAIGALLIDGELPSAEREASFRAQLGSARMIDPALAPLLADIARQAPSPATALRASLPLLVNDTPTLDQSPDERRATCVRVAAVVPSVLTNAWRLTTGQPALAADPSLGHAADFVRMVVGSRPSDEAVRAVETYLALTADHGFNNSTFTARSITSTGSSVSGAIGGAIASLAGPLHGGAPSRVLSMVEEIGDARNTERWATQQLEAGGKIMGFGHAVYRADDPRSLVLRDVAIAMGGPLVDRCVEIEKRMLALLRSWKPDAVIVTNVEFYAALALHLAGIPADMFTPAFTTSRVFGWCAHVLEQAADNKIIRPTAEYVGVAPPVAVPAP